MCIVFNLKNIMIFFLIEFLIIIIIIVLIIIILFRKVGCEAVIYRYPDGLPWYMGFITLAWFWYQTLRTVHPAKRWAVFIGLDVEHEIWLAIWQRPSMELAICPFRQELRHFPVRMILLLIGLTSKSSESHLCRDNRTHVLSSSN